MAADIPDAVSRIAVAPRQLPPNWREVPAPPELAAIGDVFAVERKGAILVVPSALVPSESNWLINPLHPQFKKIRVHAAAAFDYDERFFGPPGD